MLNHRGLRLFVFAVVLGLMPSVCFAWVKFYESEHRGNETWSDPVN